MANISFYGSHNAAIVVEENGKIITVIEIERFNGLKNSGVAQYYIPKHYSYYDLSNIITNILKFIKETYGISKYDTCVALNTHVVIGTKVHKMEEQIPAKNYTYFTHHLTHIGSTFYQSPYNEAWGVSFDGGGDDGKFCIYHCVKGEIPILIERVASPSTETYHIDYDIGFPYMVFGHYLGDINFEPSLSNGVLVYPGKLMGLVSYGKVNMEWVESFKKFYKSNPDGNNYNEKLKILGDEIGVLFDVNNRLYGQEAYDIAATSQKVFEECFIEIIKPYIEKFKGIPLCLTGGCALNIILNTRLVSEFGLNVFVSPNPNDCGLAVGAICLLTKPKKVVDITYKGLPILDEFLLQQYYNNQSKWVKFNYNSNLIIDDLITGKIIGVVRGNSEHGPRSLGNRSIFCLPSFPEMKDILNKKVKHREWYRPFAPVVRLEDVNKYFEWEHESRWMSFSPIVREEWREKLSSITHVDNTARVQTVTSMQNKWLYDLLTLLDEKIGVGVLLNTSFNVNKMPILTTIKDALYVFENSEMDSLLINETYIKKI